MGTFERFPLLIITAAPNGYPSPQFYSSGHFLHTDELSRSPSVVFLHCYRTELMPFLSNNQQCRRMKLTNLCNGSLLYGFVTVKSPIPLLFSSSIFFVGLAADDVDELEGVAPPITELLGDTSPPITGLVAVSAPIMLLLATSMELP